MNSEGISFPRAALVANAPLVLPWAVLFGPFGANSGNYYNVKTYASACVFRVISETRTSVKNPSGIVTIPGWLNGTMASTGLRP